MLPFESGRRPASECPHTPDYCWTWTAYAQQLPDGEPKTIASATSPGPQFFLPAPATDGTTVTWLDASRSSTGVAALVSWRPGSDPPRQVQTHVPYGTLSVDDDAAWVAPDSGATTLERIDLKTGDRTSWPLPLATARGVVFAGQLAYVRRPASSASTDTLTSVVVAAATSPLSGHRHVAQDHDVYTLNWANATHLIVSTNAGYAITDGKASRPLPIDQLSGVHHDNGLLTVVEHRNGRQLVIVAG